MDAKWRVIGKMDWKECIKKRIAKEVGEDKNLIKSTKEIAESKIKSAEALPDELYYGKIILLYDALREHLECLALENGYKIYNHECYTSLKKFSTFHLTEICLMK